MFGLEEGTLEVTLDMPTEEVASLCEVVRERIGEIERVRIVGEQKNFETSALFQLLVSIKVSKPETEIFFLDNLTYTFEEYATFHWILP